MEEVEVMTSFAHLLFISRSPGDAQQDRFGMHDSVRVNLCSIRSNIGIPKNVCYSIDECPLNQRTRISWRLSNVMTRKLVMVWS